MENLRTPVTRTASTTTSSELAIGVMAKAAVPGKVKTRLIPLLGADGAAQVHAQLLARTLRTCMDAAPGAVTLFAVDDEADTGWQGMPPHLVAQRVQQVGEDLGERMHHALGRLLERAPAAVLVGADCPDLRAGHLRQAHASLRGRRLVFIPALDGGYVLVGATVPCRSVFTGIPWGTDRVMRDTRAVMQGLGWRRGHEWDELEPLADLDEPQDYLNALAEGRIDVEMERRSP